MRRSIGLMVASSWWFALQGCSGQPAETAANQLGRPGVNFDAQNDTVVADTVEETPAKAPALPSHTVERSELSMKTGQRVQINVQSDISREACTALIERYRSDGLPDGQVSVRKPSNKIDGMLTPWCVENFDGRGIFYNDNMF